MHDPEACVKIDSTLPGSRVAAQLAGLTQRKKPTRLSERMNTFASRQLRGARAMREIRLLTETSTQIRNSALPKAPYSPFRRGSYE